MVLFRPRLPEPRLAVLLDKGFDLNVCDKFGLAVADHALEAERRSLKVTASVRDGTLLDDKLNI